jgi:hypothetical protein
MTDTEARKAIEAMAREINPNLPEDLTGYLLHISLGKHRCTAWVSRTNGPKPRERTWSR